MSAFVTGRGVAGGHKNVEPSLGIMNTWHRHLSLPILDRQSIVVIIGSNQPSPTAGKPFYSKQHLDRLSGIPPALKYHPPSDTSFLSKVLF